MRFLYLWKGKSRDRTSIGMVLHERKKIEKIWRSLVPGWREMKTPEEQRRDEILPTIIFNIKFIP
jgi:hypothetical protein